MQDSAGLKNDPKSVQKSDFFSTDFRRLFDLPNGVKMPPKSLILSTFRENGDIEQTLAGVVETPH